MGIQQGNRARTAIRVRTVRIGKIPALVLSGAERDGPSPGILWMHGGGYATGMKEMALFSRAAGLARKSAAVVLSPGYRLSALSPYPAALEDCYAALLYLKEHAGQLGVREDQIMVGGESAGGGLAAALCMLARDRGEVRIAFQMPLYPMLDDRDTESSRDNHGRVWNTARNHSAWKLYLRGIGSGEVPCYAAPARRTDYSGLPPAYTFVGTGEPFYAETLAYIRNLREAGIPAEADVYETDMHAFDLMRPFSPMSREAAERFEAAFVRAAGQFYAAQPDGKGPGKG